MVAVVPMRMTVVAMRLAVMVVAEAGETMALSQCHESKGPKNNEEGRL